VRIVSSLASLLGALACGDDGTAPPGDAGSDVGASMDAGPGPHDAANSGRIDAEGLRSFSQLIEECRMTCSGGAMLHDRVRDCIIYQTEGALSQPCADCFAAGMVCTVEIGCASVCDPSDFDACDRCRCGYEPMTRNCGQEVWDCAGVGEFCPVSDPGGEACVNDSDEGVRSRLWYRRLLPDGGPACP
jgi:hypothetical protein